MPYIIFLGLLFGSSIGIIVLFFQESCSCFCFHDKLMSLRSVYLVLFGKKCLFGVVW